MLKANMGSQVNICLGLLKNNFFLLLTASCQLCSTVNFCRSLWQMRVLMALQHKSTKFNRSLLTFSGSPNCQNSYTLFSFLQTQRNRYNSSLPPPLFFFFLVISGCTQSILPSILGRESLQGLEKDLLYTII